MGFIGNQSMIFLKQLKWNWIIGLSLLHIGGFRGLFILLSEAKWQTVVVCYLLSKSLLTNLMVNEKIFHTINYILGVLSAFGILAGNQVLNQLFFH